MNEKLFYDRAVAHARSRAAEGTRQLYEADLDAWLDWCAKHNVDPARPTLEAATEYRDELEDDYKPLTVRRVLASLSSMYEAAIGQETPVATWNPFKRLPKPPGDAYNHTEAVPEADALAILAKTEEDQSELGLRDAAILRLMYHLGIRRVSVALLLRADLFQRDGVRMARVYIKGNKKREVSLPEPAANALEIWLAASPVQERVFGDLTPNAVTKIVKRRGEALGLKVRPHQFRTSFITTAFDSGAPLRDIQAAAHHADPATTVRYDRGQRGQGITNAVEEFRRKK